MVHGEAPFVRVQGGGTDSVGQLENLLTQLSGDTPPIHNVSDLHRPCMSDRRHDDPYSVRTVSARLPS